ncbi:hypothetical protein QYF61_026348 [Mycteria americana]|uniref:Platelet-derived growth factor (PDGF) family profile domain-containing protein n=39 Tax=Neoaves TaxID=3078114 RepID=A0AAN7PDT2_MYCAM|nr:hypothetical protein QYF61_026348 [Mycteria americana]
MRLLGAFLRLLVAGALGAPPAPVRAGGAGGGPERGQPGPAGAAAAARGGGGRRGSSSRRWVGGRRRVPSRRPRQRPPFPPCRPRRRGGPPARSRPVSWQRAAAGAPGWDGAAAPGGLRAGPGGGARYPRGRYSLRSPAAMPGGGQRGAVPGLGAAYSPQPAPGACGTGHRRGPERSAALPRACRSSGAGMRVPGRNTPLRLPSALPAGKPEGTGGCLLRCGAGLLRPPREGRADGGAPPRRGAGGSGVPGKEETELAGRWRKSPSGWTWWLCEPPHQCSDGLTGGTRGPLHPCAPVMDAGPHRGCCTCPGRGSAGLSLSGAPPYSPPPRSLAVLTFREIWNRSFCRPLEQLVDVITEFPNEVEYIFRPSCVSLQRCGGCCGDEGLRCVPVETSTVTMQLLKIKPNGEAPYVEMAFTEHKQCECRPRQDLMRLGRRRSKGRGKRRQDKKRRKDCEL